MKMLTQDQAKALAIAIAECNRIGAAYTFTVDGVVDLITVQEAAESWEVEVKSADGSLSEVYRDLADFAQAYGV